ncbi:tRNA(Ile)-lysidine synthetase, partial [Leucobacter sp. M11]
MREALAECPAPEGGLVLVALSGGADSLALAAATAFEAAKRGIRAGAVVVDHGLQAGSDEVAARAAQQAAALGLD